MLSIEFRNIKVCKVDMRGNDSAVRKKRRGEGRATGLFRF